MPRVEHQQAERAGRRDLAGVSPPGRALPLDDIGGSARKIREFTSGDALRISQADAVFGVAGMEIAGMNGGESNPAGVPSVVD